jgi:mediator of RNA polymerase II transcription subunit 17
LRRNPDGSIFLDQGLTGAEPKALRVRIRDSSGEYTGSSRTPLPLPEDAPIESTVSQARNVIFDAELWQDINRESRSLASYGVRADDDTVTCVLTPHKTVVIDLVPLREAQDLVEKYDKTDDKIAEGVCLALHIFLSISHRQKYRRRTQPPPPISNSKQANPPYDLLRPLLTRMNHQFTLTSIHNLLQPLCNVFSFAKISPKPTYNIVPTPLNVFMLKGNSPTEIAVISLTDRLESITTFKVTEQTTIILKSTTVMFPVCATTHSTTISPESSLNITCKPPPRGDSWDRIEEYLLYATSCALASSFTESSSLGTETNPWKSTIAADAIYKQNDDVLGGQATQLMFNVGFHNGIAKLRVKWENSTPPSHQGTPVSGKGTQKGKGTYEWTSNDSAKGLNWKDGEGMVSRSLQSVIDEVGKN